MASQPHKCLMCDHQFTVVAVNPLDIMLRVWNCPKCGYVAKETGPPVFDFPKKEA